MSEGQASQLAVTLGKPAQAINDRHNSIANDRQTLPQKQEIGIVGYVAARGPEVDDRPRGGANVAVGVHVRHHIVPEAAFVAVGSGKVDVVDVGLQLGDLLGGDGQAELGLGLGQGYPKPSPSAELALRAPQLTHPP